MFCFSKNEKLKDIPEAIVSKKKGACINNFDFVSAKRAKYAKVGPARNGASALAIEPAEWFKLCTLPAAPLGDELFIRIKIEVKPSISVEDLQTQYVAKPKPNQTIDFLAKIFKSGVNTSEA